jgi:parvulin-like peptidyl-prolyl isomerase
VNRGLVSKRNAAILFGVVLVVMVAIVGIAVGVGHPSVPSDDVAVVDDSSINVPGLVEGGHISKAGFDHLLLQTAKQNGAQTAPAPGQPNYEQQKTQAMQIALQEAWIVGEANKEGITPTETQIQQQVQQIHSQFKSEADYTKARDQAGLTEEEVVAQAKLTVIKNQITEKVQTKAATPTNDDVQKFYDSNKSQFTQPAQRTIRIIQNTDAAKVNAAYQALQADSSPANWKKLAAQDSTDPTSKEKGGLRTGVVPGSFQQPLDDDIFKAPTGQVQAPVTTSTGTYVFEVESATPEKHLTLDSPVSGTTGASGTVADQIKSQLKSQFANDALTAFGGDFTDYWTNLTQCGSGYVVQGCDNFNGGPTCDPAKLGPSQTGTTGPQGCPAPVFSTCQESSGQLQCGGSGPTPAAPGQVNAFVAFSGGSPQHPHPAGEAKTPAAPSGISFPGVTGQ